MTEDAWHNISERKTSRFVRDCLSIPFLCPGMLLNAGAGGYRRGTLEWTEVTLDIFSKPIRSDPLAVCGTVESLPFKQKSFQAAICVGEVLSYCDPARAIKEFSRILDRGGILVIDFESTRSARHWFSDSSKRVADIVIDEYNGSNERVWIYNPMYIKDLLLYYGFQVIREASTHRWSALAVRVGLSRISAAFAESSLSFLPLPSVWADLKTIAALLVTDER